MADAHFLIEDSPSADRGYDAVAGQTLALVLEHPEPDIYKVEFSIADPSDPQAPLASKDAPVLLLDPLDGIAPTPSSVVLVTMPMGVHSYAIRCQVNNGVEAATGRPVPEWTFDRIVSIRSSNGLRKIIPGERTEYSAAGWADAQNEEIEALGEGGGGGGGNVFVFLLQGGGVSTALASGSSKLSLGAVPFDPSVLTASGTRVKSVYFEAILQTSHAAHLASVDLFDVGAGAVVVDSAIASSMLAPTYLRTLVDLAEADPGIFQARLWMAPQDPAFVVTCFYAALVVRLEEPPLPLTE